LSRSGVRRWRRHAGGAALLRAADVRDVGRAARHHRGRERLGVPAGIRGAARARRGSAAPRARDPRAARSRARGRRAAARPPVSPRSRVEPRRPRRIPGARLSRALDPIAAEGSGVARAVLPGRSRARLHLVAPRHLRRLARELLGQQRAEGLGGEARGAASEPGRARSLELQVRARRADLRADRSHHHVEPDALLGAARHRREQAERVDQDPRQDLRAHAGAARRAPARSGGGTLRARAPRRRETRATAAGAHRDGAAQPDDGPRVSGVSGGGPGVKTYEEIDAELAAFEQTERQRLGLDEPTVAHWRDANPQRFTRAERAHTTILFGGLTVAHDELVQAALAGLGYHVQPLDVPDTDALRVGKEFGNRAQCNPTYFTVGNLVKHLIDLRDRQGIPVDEIIRTHVFFTAGACGPCRFGTYVTEYRKALRDAGFDGFRVLLFQQQGGLRQATGEDAGLDFSPRFFIALLKALVLGDVLNLLGYRIRPYEVDPGATDRALAASKTILRDALAHRRLLLPALWRARRALAAVRVHRLQPKPKVAIIGEFWAMTTEGDGNYRLQRFLESEGAEVDIQPVTAWLLYNIWEHTWDTRRRMTLRRDDGGTFGLEGTRPRRKLLLLAAAERALRATFAGYARALGLR